MYYVEMRGFEPLCLGLPFKPELQPFCFATFVEGVAAFIAYLIVLRRASVLFYSKNG